MRVIDVSASANTAGDERSRTTTRTASRGRSCREVAAITTRAPPRGRRLSGPVERGEQLPLAGPHAVALVGLCVVVAAAGAARRARGAARARRGRCRRARALVARHGRADHEVADQRVLVGAVDGRRRRWGTTARRSGREPPMWSRLSSAIASRSTNSTLTSPGPVTPSAASTAATTSRPSCATVDGGARPARRTTWTSMGGGGAGLRLALERRSVPWESGQRRRGWLPLSTCRS